MKYNIGDLLVLHRPDSYVTQEGIYSQGIILENHNDVIYKVMWKNGKVSMEHHENIRKYYG